MVDKWIPAYAGMTEEEKRCGYIINIFVLHLFSMAKTVITFEDPIMGYQIKAPVGLSHATLFFGPVPAFLRSDWKWGLIILITSIITLGLNQLYFWVSYNRLYIKDLVSQDFEVADVQGSTIEKLEKQLHMHLPVLEKSARQDERPFPCPLAIIAAQEKKEPLPPPEDDDTPEGYSF